MKPEIESILETTRPSLRESERSTLWLRIRTQLDQPVRSSFVSPYHRWFPQRRTAWALVAICILMSGGVSTALAEKARPGDRFFPLDEALEKLELRFARTQNDRDRIGAAHAEERIVELRQIVAETQGKEGSNGAGALDGRVGDSVDAIMRVMSRSEMNDTAREHVYKNLFNELDELSLTIHVNDSEKSKVSRERVQIDQGELGETKIEIREDKKRTRIEKKGGQVRIQYDEDGALEDESDVRGKKRGLTE